jgi:alkylation response protein AidB-like acyl-CoA dehydrogenase
MDFRLNEDQKALRQGVRSFCDGRLPLETLHDLATKGGFDAALWRELAELGVFSLRLPESAGGVGLGSADAVVVFAELGRRLAPGPLAFTHLAAALVPGAASGDVVVGGLDRTRPSSEPILVEHLPQLGALLVLSPDGVERIDPRALEAEPVATPLDPLTPVHLVRALPRGERVGGPEDAARLRREGAVLVSAQLLGIAEFTTELAVEYAKKREQFGRPIAGFQAVKHLCADMFVRQEVARAAVYAAGATLDDPAVGDLERAVSAAKITAGEGALRNARTCIQVYGGMGFTWEMPPHYYLKRSWVLANVFGTSEEHEERVAERVASKGDGVN